MSILKKVSEHLNKIDKLIQQGLKVSVVDDKIKLIGGISVKRSILLSILIICLICTIVSILTFNLVAITSWLIASFALSSLLYVVAGKSEH